MKAYLNRRYRFSASHRLHQETFSAAKNAEVYGKCNNPHGHGHNYVLQVTVSGPVDPATGMVCNLGDLDAFVGHHILEVLDTTNLNEFSAFRETVPTTENLCIFLYKTLKSGFQHAAVERVLVEETSNNSFEYAGEKDAALQRNI